MNLNDIALTEKVTGERILPTSCLPSLGESCGGCHRCTDPQPVECPACDGTRIEYYRVGRTNQTRPCSRCYGEGVVEP